MRMRAGMFDDYFQFRFLFPFPFPFPVPRIPHAPTGLLDCYTTSGSVNGPKFEEFVEQFLAPVINPFDGVNPNSVVVLDNASIHHVDRVVQAIQTKGAMVHFLPPYCPDLNPIEESFSKVKSVLKANEEALFNMDTETAVLTAFNTITPHDCMQWIKHAGYD